MQEGDVLLTPIPQADGQVKTVPPFSQRNASLSRFTDLRDQYVIESASRGIWRDHYSCW